ncbi:hypothetical protein MHU86_6017 [Fragilaria crotonensis]|nr:hypothetical protein MHU86_6017 [Fragilaria crotonensis]
MHPKLQCPDQEQSHNNPTPKWFHIHLANTDQRTPSSQQAFSTISNSNLPSDPDSEPDEQHFDDTTPLLTPINAVQSPPYLWNSSTDDLLSEISATLWSDPFTKHGMTMS